MQICSRKCCRKLLGLSFKKKFNSIRLLLKNWQRVNYTRGVASLHALIARVSLLPATSRFVVCNMTCKIPVTDCANDRFPMSIPYGYFAITGFSVNFAIPQYKYDSTVKKHALLTPLPYYRNNRYRFDANA